ncbi:MAG: 1-hydroxycarotenoid 3,4-desaturase CrtD [Bacteroidota bacterium]
MAPSTAIIGSGIAGIGSALRMAAKGHNVTVYEQSSIVGGKISEFYQDGFRFDTGPSLFTLPSLVDELFELFGEDPRKHFQYRKLEISCKYFWDDGTIINAWQDNEKLATEVETATGVPRSRIKDFFHKSKNLYDITAEIFMFNSLHKLSNFTKPAFRKSLLRVHEIDAFSTMHKKNQKWFQHPKIVQMFDRYATYNGSDPYQTPATLNIIAHLEHNIGAFFPDKGMYSIVNALTHLARRKGIMFMVGQPVQKVIMEANKAIALKVNNEIKPYDNIISNVDVETFYKNLLPDHKPPFNENLNQRSTSALIFYWGINTTFPSLEVHNILFSNDYKKEFDHLFNIRSITNDPTVYIFISSKTVKGDAPEGMENWYVMINVPENRDQNWEEMIKEARQNIIIRINKILKTNIEKHILFEKIADPRTIERDTGSYRGSLYGPSSNSKLAAFLRHPNFRRRFSNLYFTGGSVHPGGGIPLSLASAKIACQEIP